MPFVGEARRYKVHCDGRGARVVMEEYLAWLLSEQGSSIHYCTVRLYRTILSTMRTISLSRYVLRLL
jgi:hypothetical protein